MNPHPDIDYYSLYQWMQNNAEFHPWAEQLLYHIQRGLDHKRFGDLTKWYQALSDIPPLDINCVHFSPSITIKSQKTDINPQLLNALQKLIPWRKGPFSIDGIDIDAEWRSDYKWLRIAPYLDNLKYQRILDVGCGNGYFMYRMLEQQPELLLGIDPSPRFVVQFYMIKKLLRMHAQWRDPAIHLLPIGIENIPDRLEAFDRVLSMGVLYHRKSPIDHISQCFDALKAGGQLILETLVVEDRALLFPQNRYAAMPNVWFIPSVDILVHWIERCKFIDVNVRDITTTSTDEQRQTRWMKYHSLANFLDNKNPKLTIEGYPAPIRATITATKPDK